MKAVADRWGKRYAISNMDKDTFCRFMRDTLAQYGWEETEIEEMVKRALRKRR